MLFFLPHIFEDLIENEKGYHIKRIDIFIKNCFMSYQMMKWMIFLKRFGVSILTSITRIFPFMEMISSGVANFFNGNSHTLYQKYSLQSTKVLGFLACRVASKFIGIGAAGFSWGDYKTLKYGNRYVITSDVSHK